MPPDKFTVALVQMSCGPEPADNMAKALDRVAEAAKRGAQVVCLPELFQTQYFCQREDRALFDLAEPIPGPGTEKLAAAAKQQGVVLVASLFEKRALGLYHNTAAIFDSRRRAARHLPQDAHSRRSSLLRKVLFHSRRSRLTALDTSAGKIGTLVCWDQWYPEGARLTALQGANVLFYPTAIGWHPAEKAEFGVAQHDAWRTIQRAHAIANGVYVGGGEPRRLRNWQHSRQVGARAKDWNSGADRFSAIPSAACSPKRRTIKRKFCWAKWI